MFISTFLLNLLFLLVNARQRCGVLRGLPLEKKKVENVKRNAAEGLGMRAERRRDTG